MSSVVFAAICAAVYYIYETTRNNRIYEEAAWRERLARYERQAGYREQAKKWAAERAAKKRTEQ